MKMGDIGDVKINELDLQDSITNEDLLEVFVSMIIEVRSSDSQNYIELKSALSKLEALDVQTQTSRNVTELLNIYESVKSVSIEVRKVLNNFMNGVAQYDKITYTFYYMGQRYATDELKAEWLVASQSSGTLKLNLDKAAEELSAEAAKGYRGELNDLFNKHYATYEAAIVGTYSNGKGSGIGHHGALNYGHIAEAYEQHIMEHHPEQYKIINLLDSTDGQLTTAEKMSIGFASEVDSINYWSIHEGMNQAWQHVREAMGVQRGTVAGDVLGRQVKSAKKKNASKVRLATLNTLRQGVESYCKILSDESAEQVAQELINYMGEPVRKISANMINNINIQDNELIALLTEKNEIIEYLRKNGIRLWKL